jgi:hypothetical protein
VKSFVLIRLSLVIHPPKSQNLTEFSILSLQDVAQLAHRLKQQPNNREAIAEYLSKQNEQLLNGHSSKVNSNRNGENDVHSCERIFLGTGASAKTDAKAEHRARTPAVITPSAEKQSRAWLRRRKFSIWQSSLKSAAAGEQ